MKLNLLLFGFVFMFLNSKAQNIPLYVGTYTSGDSEGIYQLQFNTETGALTNKQLAIAAENPSFISFSPDKKIIYTVSEGSSSSVIAFKVKMDGTLEHINTESSNGKGPCHISLNETGTKAVVSNYHGGTVSVYAIKADGGINEASQIFNHNTNDEKSHAHSALFSEDNLFVADLGTNKLYQYRLKDNNKFELYSFIKMEGNPGPRHFTLSKDKKFIYIINEYGGSITTVKKTKSGLKKIDHDSTLDKNFKEKNKCADIHLSKDERFLYGSNRGENTIAVFKRNQKKGTIKKIQSISVHGDWPRNFTLDPSGKFLLVANKKSNNISVFKVNTNDGTLSFLHSADLPMPVCLLF